MALILFYYSAMFGVLLLNLCPLMTLIIADER